MTLQETYATRLITAGGRLAKKQPSRYLLIEFPFVNQKTKANDIAKVYLGKAGAIRTGDTVTASRSMKESFLDRLISLAV